MEIKYILTDYFEKNDLLDNQSSEGLTIKKEGNAILINGGSKDLIELADLIVNVALEKQKEHIHIDDLTLLNKESDFSEIIIEKKG